MGSAKLTKENKEKITEYIQNNPGCPNKVALIELTNAGVPGLNKGIIAYYKKRLGQARRKYGPGIVTNKGVRTQGHIPSTSIGAAKAAVMHALLDLVETCSSTEELDEAKKLVKIIKGL